MNTNARKWEENIFSTKYNNDIMVITKQILLHVFFIDVAIICDCTF